MCTFPKVAGQALLGLMLSCGASSVAAQPPPNPIQLTASDAALGDAFGRSVAISGDTVLVGAPGDDERGENAGAAYVFVREADGRWVERQKLLPAELQPGDFFGWSVELDGNTAIIGARGVAERRGAAYLYARGTTVWEQQSRLQPAELQPGDAFGWQVAISGDDLLISAPGVDYLDYGKVLYPGQPVPIIVDNGRVFAFHRSPSGWRADASMTSNGGSVAMSNGVAAVGRQSDPATTYLGWIGQWRRVAGGWAWEHAVQPVAHAPAHGDAVTTWVDGSVLWLNGNSIERVDANGRVSALFSIPQTSPGAADAWSTLESDGGTVWVGQNYLVGSGDRRWMIWRRAPGGTWSWFAEGSSPFLSRVSLAGDHHGGLYVIDGCTVYHVTATLEKNTVAGSPSECGTVDGPLATARFQNLAGIALAGTDTLYLLETRTKPSGYDGGRLRRVHVSSGIVDTVDTPLLNGTGLREGWASPPVLSVQGDGTLWVANGGRVGTLESGDVAGGNGGVRVTSRGHLISVTKIYFRTIDGTGVQAGLEPRSMTFAFDGKMAFTDCNGVLRTATKAGDVRTISGTPCLSPDSDGWIGYDLDVRGGTVVAGSPRSPLVLSPMTRVGYAWVATGEGGQALAPGSAESFARYGSGVTLTAAGEVVVGPANGCLWIDLTQCVDDARGTPNADHVLPLRLYRRLGGTWRERPALPVDGVAPHSGCGTALDSDGTLLVSGAPEWDYRPQDPPPHGDMVGPGRVFVYDLATLDTDGDSMPDDWEDRFGLDPADPADGARDADADGLTNAEEFAAHSHPRNDPTLTQFLAEGATSEFFETEFSIANPGTTEAIVNLRFMKTGGELASSVVQVPPMATRSVRAGALPDMASREFSTVVESDVPVVADRLMTWDRPTAYGSHLETAVTAPALTWYLAEGATHSGFDLFYLLQNPSTSEARVRVRYLRPAPAPPLERILTLPPTSRTNIWVDYETFLEESPTDSLANTDVSAVIEVLNAVPIIVERAMYLTRGGQQYTAGHESAGVTAPSTRWFLAEGSTQAGFDLFVLMANPSATDAAVEARFLLSDGTVVVRTYVVPASSRFNVWVNLEGPELRDQAISTIVTVTNDVPIIVERAMWWPGPAWHEGHNSPGTTVTGTAWAVAAGAVTPAADTFLLVANTSDADGDVLVTLLFEDGTPPLARTFRVMGRSRLTVHVRVAFPEALGRRFGAVVESLGEAPAQIVVERALYTDAGGVHWAAGGNSLATRLR